MKPLETSGDAKGDVQPISDDRPPLEDDAPEGGAEPKKPESGASKIEDKDQASPKKPESGGAVGRSLFRSGLIVSLLLLFAKVTGLVRDVVFAAQFGLEADMQAYSVGTIASMFLIQTLSMGSLSGAMIPGYLRRCEQQSPEAGFAYWRAIGLGMGGVILLLSVAHYFLAAPLVAALGPGLRPAVQHKTVELVRLFSLGIPLSYVAGWFTVLLHANRRFVEVGLRSACLNIALIFGIWAFFPSLGALSFIIGTLLGNLSEICIQLPFVMRLWRKHGKKTVIASPHREFIVDYLPLVSSAILLNMLMVLDRSYATLATAMGAAVMLYAERLVEISRALVGRTIATVLMPELASVSEDTGKTDALIATSLSVVTVVTIPIGLGLCFFGDSLSYTLFMGRLKGEDLQALFSALQGLSATAVLFSMIWVLDRVYAGRRWSRMLLLFVALGVGLNWLLKALDPSQTLFTVTIASSIGLALTTVLAVGHLHRKLGAKVMRPFYIDVMGALLCFAAPSFVVLWLREGMAWTQGIDHLWVTASFGVASLIGIYLFWFLALPMCAILPKRLRPAAMRRGT